MRSTFLLFFFVSFLTAQTDSIQSTLVFLSDTQAPMWVEKLYLKDYDNEKATQNIFSSILKEQKLDAVIHCGDITAYGMSRSKWEAVLPFIDSLKARTIPFIAAKGNHDYYFFSGRAMRNYEEYIPAGRKEYSLYTFGSTAIIVLNSNVEELEDSVRRQQHAWYASTLQSLDTDSTVHFIITVDHHSPFTNSTMVTGSSVIRKEYLPVFYSSVKSKLFVSGHAHRFEHFRKKGKDFLVIGGGGGLFHDKRTENPDEDLHKRDGRFFHYVKCSVYADSLSLNVVKVEPRSSETKELHHVTIAR
jgi:predicted phosphodiesterase